MELSKNDKKKVRSLIDKDFAIELKEAMSGYANIIEDWKQEKIQDYDAFENLRKSINKFGRYIDTAYLITGSRYLIILDGLLSAEIFNAEDLDDLSEPLKEHLLNCIKE